MQIELNIKYEIPLSIDGIEEFITALEKKKEELPEIAKNVIKNTVKIGLENNLSSAIEKPIEVNGNVVTGGIITTDPIDLYREFGTGIVGSNSPHPDKFSGWIYDINEHGEKGWFYPKGDGTFGWTKGIPAGKKFYEAMQRMEEAMPKIMQEELGG